MIARHWPGALTLVLPAAPDVPASVRHPDGTIALRCPGNEFLRRTVQLAGGIVVSTSANSPGEPPMTRAGGALDQAVDLVVDQGELPGTASTIVSVEREAVRVLREGAVRIER
jgi:L-threonylcarbamoyladenylate synthase